MWGPHHNTRWPTRWPHKVGAEQLAPWCAAQLWPGSPGKYKPGSPGLWPACRGVTWPGSGSLPHRRLLAVGAARRPTSRHGRPASTSGHGGQVMLMGCIRESPVPSIKELLLTITAKAATTPVAARGGCNICETTLCPVCSRRSVYYTPATCSSRSNRTLTLKLYVRCLLQTRCELGWGDRHDWIKRHGRSDIRLNSISKLQAA